MGFLTAKYDREKDLAVKRQEAYEDGVDHCQKCGKTKEDAAAFFRNAIRIRKRSRRSL